METSILFTLFVLAIPVVVNADALCGGNDCIGFDAYCCTLDDGSTGCCWETYVYQLWWFWIIWVVVFLLIMACSVAGWRWRRQRVRYVVMASSEYPTYGTVVHTSNTASTAYPASPPVPPSYAASQAKPPPYTYSQ